MVSAYQGIEGAAQQESRVLMLSDQARSDAILLIDGNDVTAGPTLLL